MKPIQTRYANKIINKNYYKEIKITPSGETSESSNVIFLPWVICSSQAEFNEIMRKKLKSGFGIFGTL